MLASDESGAVILRGSRSPVAAWERARVLGLAWIVHAVPFQCSASVPPGKPPTAKQSFQAPQFTAFNVVVRPIAAVPPVGFGLVTIDHD
jgi:hypothetical protein